jgi:hypothetical protein
MPSTSELLARIEQLHAEASGEIATNRRLRAEASVLLNCLHEGLSQIAETAARSRHRLPDRSDRSARSSVRVRSRFDGPS